MSDYNADPLVQCNRKHVEDQKPKPDGWHTYHICDGVIREITGASKGAGSFLMHCNHCGEVLTGVISKPRPIIIAEPEYPDHTP